MASAYVGKVREEGGGGGGGGGGGEEGEGERKCCDIKSTKKARECIPLISCCIGKHDTLNL